MLECYIGTSKNRLIEEGITEQENDTLGMLYDGHQGVTRLGLLQVGDMKKWDKI